MVACPSWQAEAAWWNASRCTCRSRYGTTDRCALLASTVEAGSAARQGQWQRCWSGFCWKPIDTGCERCEMTQAEGQRKNLCEAQRQRREHVFAEVRRGLRRLVRGRSRAEKAVASVLSAESVFGWSRSRI